MRCPFLHLYPLNLSPKSNLRNRVTFDPHSGHKPVNRNPSSSPSKEKFLYWNVIRRRLCLRMSYQKRSRLSYSKKAKSLSRRHFNSRKGRFNGRVKRRRGYGGQGVPSASGRSLKENRKILEKLAKK